MEMSSPHMWLIHTYLFTSSSLSFCSCFTAHSHHLSQWNWRRKATQCHTRPSLGSEVVFSVPHPYIGAHNKKNETPLSIVFLQCQRNFFWIDLTQEAKLYIPRVERTSEWLLVRVKNEKENVLIQHFNFVILFWCNPSGFIHIYTKHNTAHTTFLLLCRGGPITSYSTQHRWCFFPARSTVCCRIFVCTRVLPPLESSPLETKKWCRFSCRESQLL